MAANYSFGHLLFQLLFAISFLHFLSIFFQYFSVAFSEQAEQVSAGRDSTSHSTT